MFSSPDEDFDSEEDSEEESGSDEEEVQDVPTKREGDDDAASDSDGSDVPENRRGIIPKEFTLAGATEEES